MVQLRWDDGKIAEYSNMAEAFEAFYNQKDCWKISFECPSGKRLRIVKLDSGLSDKYGSNMLEIGYSEEMISRELNKDKRQ